MIISITNDIKQIAVFGLSSLILLVCNSTALVAQIPQNIEVADPTEQVNLWETPFGMVSIAILFLVMVGIYFVIRRRKK